MGSDFNVWPLSWHIYNLYFVTEYIAEYKDWLGAPEPCPYRMEPQWAGPDPVADTAEASAL